MKKYGMIFLSVIFLFMTLCTNVHTINAEELESKTLNYDNYSTFLATYGEQMEQVRTYLEEIGTYNYYIVTSPGYDSFFVRLYTSQNILSGIELSESGSTLYFNHQSIRMNNIYIEFGSSYDFETQFNLLKTKIDNKEYEVSSSGSSYSSSYNSSSDIRSTFNFMYATNFNYILSSDSVYSLNVNGTIIQPGESIPTYYDYLQSQNNEFNEIIMTDVYSKVEIEFEIPLSTKTCTKQEVIDGVITDIEYICPILELDYSIFNSDVNGNLNTMTFGIPYIEKTYLYDTGNSSITKIDVLSLSDNMSNIYEGNYVIDYDSSITNLKLVIDLFGLDYSYVNIQFSSNIPFNVTYYEKETESEYIGSVDITGKAGVMFIPKKIDNDMLSTFSFYPSMYSIQLRDTYKEDYKVLSYYSVGYCDYRDYKDDIPYVCNEGTNYNISVKFAKGNLEQSLFIVNRVYPQTDKSIIYYDTRYFHYVIYNTLADTPTFIHPITGEESIATSLIDFDSSITDQESFFEMVRSGFNRFKGVIIDIFQNINYFFTNSASELQYFYIVVFALILFMFIMKFLL